MSRRDGSPFCNERAGARQRHSIFIRRHQHKNMTRTNEVLPLFAPIRCAPPRVLCVRDRMLSAVDQLHVVLALDLHLRITAVLIGKIIIKQMGIHKFLKAINSGQERHLCNARNEIRASVVPSLGWFPHTTVKKSNKLAIESVVAI